MKVALIADTGNQDGTVGGAELTMREFAAAAPKPVTLVDTVEQADVAVIGNCVQMSPRVIGQLDGHRVIRYHNDLARHEHPELRAWLDEHAVHIFTSPYHQKLYRPRTIGAIVPPALELGRYRNGRHNPDREGAVAIAPWQNPGKGQLLLKEWSEANGPVDVYGPGPYQPAGGKITTLGPLPHKDIPGVLRRYRTFVHLPTEPEPFGRAVVEAWAAGCKLVVNRQVGALHYLENDPDALETAGADFWRAVCE